MSDHGDMLARTIDGLFGDITAAAGDAADGWSRIEELGIADLLLPEADGGMDASWQDAAILFRLAGYHALPLPVGETAIVRKLLRDAGLGVPPGPLAIGDSSDAVIGTGFTGTVAMRSSEAGHVLVDGVLLNCGDATRATRQTNVAGEARDILHFEAAPLVRVAGADADMLTLLGALLRSCQSAGALRACLERSAQYCGERSQFGRPLQKFQAIQHQLALLAEEAAAVLSASLAAAAALDRGEAGFEIACAKLRSNQAAGPATSIAHQVHGAIGFTREYGLYRHSQRLWAWRSEFGNDRHWAQTIGKIMLAPGGQSAWAAITARGEAA